METVNDSGGPADDIGGPLDSVDDSGGPADNSLDPINDSGGPANDIGGSLESIDDSGGPADDIGVPLETTNNRGCTSVNPFHSDTDFDTDSLIFSEASKTVFDTTDLEAYIYQLITESAVVPLVSDFTLKVNLCVW